ncbi:MAG TPA: thrombospondin type 3 repeat-containing protein [Polyangia bacterium]
MRALTRPFAVASSVALGVVFAAGCSGASTEVRVEVSGPTGEAAPASVSINVFDRFGLIGHADIAPAVLPGAISVRGLPDAAEDLRVVGIGLSATGVQSLGGTRVTVQPLMRTVATILLSTNAIDSDGDLVPDTLDDCPSVADPMQDNPCITIVDLGTSGGEADLSSVPPGSDLAVPPDLAPPASGCAAAGVAFCDGFEGGVIDPHWNDVTVTNGTVTVDNTRAYRGSWSLHIHNNALPAKGSADVELNEGQTFPSTHFFVRAYVYVPSAFSATEGDFILAEQAASPFKGVTLGLVNGAFQTDNSIAGITKTSTTTMPRDQWVCVEWEVQLASSGSTALSVNGQAATNLGGTQNLSINPAPSELGLALVTTAPPSGGVAARDLWFDEVMINPTAIGCAR